MANLGHSCLRLHHYFDELKQASTELVRLLRQTPVHDARIFELPHILRNDENTLLPSSILVKQISAHQSALSLACQTYNHFWVHENPNVSTRHPHRLPGVLILEETTKKSQLLEIVAEVNRLKELFEMHTLDIPAELRFSTLHDMLPGLMTLHVYRKIFISDDIFYSIRFFWANKQYIQKVTKNELIAKLQKSKVNPGRQFLDKKDLDAWQDAVEQELDIVMNVAESAELRIRRPIKVQPMARLTQKKLYNDEKTYVKQVANPIPIILFNQNNSLRVGSLADYNAEVIAHKRSPTPAKIELLIDRLHLYKLI